MLSLVLCPGNHTCLRPVWLLTIVILMVYTKLCSQVICASETNGIQAIWTKYIGLQIGFMPVLTCATALGLNNGSRPSVILEQNKSVTVRPLCQSVDFQDYQPRSLPECCYIHHIDLKFNCSYGYINKRKCCIFRFSNSAPSHPKLIVIDKK